METIYEMGLRRSDDTPIYIYNNSFWFGSLYDLLKVTGPAEIKKLTPEGERFWMEVMQKRMGAG